MVVFDTSLSFLLEIKLKSLFSREFLIISDT